MKRLWGLLLFLSLGSLGFLTAEKPAPQKPEMIRVHLDRQGVDQQDSEGCGPVSLLNLLQFGPKEHQQAFAEITQQKTNLQALKALAAKYSQ